MPEPIIPTTPIVAPTTPTGTPPAAGGAAAGTPTLPAADWMTSLTPEARLLVDKKQFKDPNMVLDSYANLEKLMGVPKEQLLKLPIDEAAPEWNEVYERLGKPKDAAGYKFEIPAENGADPEFVKWAQETFHGANLTAGQAKAIMGKWNESQAAQIKATSEARIANETQSKTALQTEWGNAFEQNKNIANAAKKEFGITDEMLAKLDQSMGSVNVIKFLHTIGSKLGEATFTQGLPAQGGSSSPEVARAEIQSLKKDTDFMKKYISGDKTAVAKMDKLHRDLVSIK